MDGSSGTRWDEARGRRLVVLGAVALISCGGRVGTPHRDGAAGSPGDSGASAAAAGVTGTGGAGSVREDGGDDRGDSTDDACPCPPRQSSPDSQTTFAHYESVACGCSSTACPTSIDECERDLCDQVEALGAGEVVRGVGCGLVRASLAGESSSFDWVFEEGPDVLVGAALSSAAPSGRCSVESYLYGRIYDCPNEELCHLCGDQRLGLPSCRPPL
jgi:hypothetical protein